MERWFVRGLWVVGGVMGCEEGWVMRAWIVGVGGWSAGGCGCKGKMVVWGGLQG